METQEEADWQDRCWVYEKLAEGISVPCCNHGVNMDIWCADSGGGGTGPSGLHLHHPGGLPRCLYLHTLCDVRQEGQRKLCQNMELDQGIRPSQQLAEDHSTYTSGEYPHSAHASYSGGQCIVGSKGARGSRLASQVLQNSEFVNCAYRYPYNSICPTGLLFATRKRDHVVLDVSRVMHIFMPFMLCLLLSICPYYSLPLLVYYACKELQ